MTNQLTVREQSMELTPQEIVSGATSQAKLLMDIVQKTGCYLEVSGKKYLQVEAWETIGAFNRTHAVTHSVTPITGKDEVIGYIAEVNLYKDGDVVGSAIMPCFFTENCCKGKEGDAKHKACMSAAQTFATSKAYRLNYSYIAILAGYQPLPAEEITEDMVSEHRPEAQSEEHWCAEHKCKFIKTAKMKSYAHKIQGTDKWCNEHNKPLEVVKTPDAESKDTTQKLWEG